MIAKNENNDYDDGGNGGIDDPQNFERRHKRETLGMISRALKEGWVKPWTLPDGIAASLPKQVLEVIQAAQADGDNRTFCRAVECLQNFITQNIKIAEVADKAERLDQGQATDNQAVTILELSFDDQG
jgi:hypothetical protein